MTPGFDITQALRCARITAALYQPRTPPQRLLDHLAHLEHLTRDGFADETPPCEQPTQSTHDLCDATEAAETLGVTPQYVRRIHTDLDGQRIAGRWIFHRQKVLDYAHSKHHHQPNPPVASRPTP